MSKLGLGERGAQIQVNRFNKGSKTFTQIIMQVKNPCAPEKQNLNVTKIKNAQDKKLDYGTIDDTLSLLLGAIVLIGMKYEL